MPDHIHGLCIIKRGTLSENMRLLKGRIAWHGNKLLGRSGKFWQAGFYDHGLREDEAVEPIVRYMLNNPVRAGLVADYREWKWKYPQDI